MNIKLDTGYTAQSAYIFLHRILLQLKLSHYVTKHYPAHEAFGTVYATIEGMVDDITEQLIGYSGVDPKSLAIGNVDVLGVAELGDLIVREGRKLQDFASRNEYSNIENLAQELSGAGAKLKYLKRF